jgi:Domain of unknown function (DUF4129)
MFVPLYVISLVLVPALHRPLAEGPTPRPSVPASADLSPVQQALRQGEYPWYDSGEDRVRGVWPPTWVKWMGEKWRAIGRAIDRFFRWMRLPSINIGGNYLGTILLLAVLAAFFAFLLVLWVRREPFGAGPSAARVRPGTALLMDQLPEELRPGLSDPWGEAQRRRAAGDFAGAVIYLFAHQLLSLDRAGLIRLAPGWTGRHYVRSMRDPVLVDSLGATLRLFEEIYYGHRRPSAAVFEQVWSRAQALEARRGELEVSR